MLKRIRLKNYQGHEDTTIVFSPRVTGIIGLSLSGKTGIVRGLRWVKENRPSSFRFHSHFAKSGTTSVQVDVDESTIKAEKSNKSHSYRINDNKPLRKFGRGVPEEVTELLNIGDINIQYEFDDPFLIRGSRPEIARTISKAVNTDIIERAVSKIRKKTNSLKAERKFIKNDVEDLRDRLQSLEGIDAIRPLIADLKRFEDNIAKLEQEFEDLEEVKSKTDRLQKKIEKTEDLLKIKPMLEKLQKMDTEIDLLRIERRELKKRKELKTYITTAKKVFKKKVKEYIVYIKKHPKCPTCFGALDKESIRRIKNEILTIK